MEAENQAGYLLLPQPVSQYHYFATCVDQYFYFFSVFLCVCVCVCVCVWVGGWADGCRCFRLSETVGMSGNRLAMLC